MGDIDNRLGSEGARPALSLEGGSFTFNGLNLATPPTTQSVGQVTLASGASVITVARNTAGTPCLVGTGLAVTPGAYAQFVGTSLGASALNVSQIYFTTAPSTVGGGGADASPTKSIVPATRIGNDFVAYGLYGIRPLATSEYTATADINTAGNTDNVKFSSGALSALAGNKTVNSLAILGGTSPWNMGAGNTLTLTSGQLLSSVNLTLAQGAVTAGAGSDTDLDIVPTGNTLTMSANITDNGSGKVKLVKSGGGTLTLSATTDNTYSGGTVVNEGALGTSGTVADRRFFGTGPVKADNAVLSLTAVGSTANSTGDDYTAVNAAQINVANLAYTGDDTFNIESGSVIAGASATAGLGLNSLSRGYNVTLADGAVIGKNTALSAPLNLGTGTIKDLGTGADLYYGLNGNQNNVNGSVTVGSGTPFKGISTDRSARSWQQGTIDVAAGTTDIALQGLPIPGAAPYALTLGNGLTAGAPVIGMNGSGTVDAHVYGYVTLDDDQALFGDTTAGEVVDFTVDSGAYLTANREGAMGAGTGIATATVKHGGTMTTVGTIVNNPWAALGGDVTVEAGGRLIVNTPLGLTGAGELTFKTGSILEIQGTDAFSGPQAAAATFEPGVIVRLNANPGSASDPLDNYLGDTSPVYELYNGNRTPANPLALGTPVMTLNRDAGGLGGMLVNDNLSRTYGLAPNGVIAIGTNGGVIAATRFTTLTVSQPIALSSNELVIGSTEKFDWVSEPKLGRVDLTASIGASTATNGSRITVLPGVELRNGGNSLPDMAEVAVGGAFYAAADTIGSLSGTGLVTVSANNLTVGRNNADTVFSGVLAGGNYGFYKTGAGRLDLTGDKNTFTGTFRVNGGELALSGNGKLLNTGNTAFTLVENGVLHLDNSETNLADRLTGAAPGVTFNGGTLRFTGKDGAASSETLGRPDFSLNASTIEIINGSGAGSSAELTFGTAIASATPVGSLNLTAQNGTLGTAGYNPRVKMTGLTAGSVIGFATVDGAPAYYDATYGFRAYTLAESTEFNGTATQTTLDTVFTAANLYPTLTASRTVKSLWIDSPGTGKFVDLSATVGGNYSLTLSSGRLHLTGADDFEIKRTTGTGTLGATPTYIYLYIDEPGTTLTLSAPTAKAIQKGGPGTFKINAACTFTGGLIINDGTVTYGASGDLAATSLQTWNDGLFDLAGKSDTLGALTLYAGGITNSVESVASTLTITTLTMGSGPAGSSAFVDMGTNGTLKLGGTVTYNAVNDPDTACIRGKELNLNGATRTFAVNDSVAPSAWIDLDIPATLAGAASYGVTKTGSGTLRLSGANTFDGPLNITGTLRLVHPQAHGLPSTTRALTVNASSSLVLDNANGNIDVPGNYTLSLNGSGNAAVGPVSGAIINWSGDNSLSGATTLANATTLASLSGTLTLSGDITGNYALTVQGDGDMLLAGARGGTSTLTKNGAGTLTLTGASGFTGAVTLYAGVMNVRNNTALGTVAGGVTTYIGSELQLQNDVTIGAETLSLRGTGLSNGGALRNISGTNTYGGKITLGMTDVRINSDAGKLIIDMASGNAIEGATFNVLFGGAGDIEVADPIATGMGMLTKDVSGTLILGGVNTYTGATTVDDGSLRVNGSIIAGSAVTVKDGAALEGTGTCLGTVTARSGATVAPGVPGTAGGTLTIATLNLEAGSVCAFECTAAPANDKLVVSGSGKLTIAAGTCVALYAAGTTNAWAMLGTNSLFQYTGTLNGGVENLAVVNPDSDVLYTFFTEDNWIKVRIEAAKVSALAASELTPSSGKANGEVVDVAADDPTVWFCWDTGDKGTAATSDWAHVEYVGVYAKGQSFSKVLTGLLSGSNYAYRVYAENSVGGAWSPEAIGLTTVYLPSISNAGARVTGPGTVLLQGEVTDPGSEAPHVWFRYWQGGTATTNEIDVGAQAGYCSCVITDLPLGVLYEYLLVASNQAGSVVSETRDFTTAVIYHVSDAVGNDANDGSGWPTALKTIAAAIALAKDGDTILVTNGTYSITAQLTLDKALNLVSVSGRALTGIRGNNNFRLLYIDNPFARVSGFTFSQGRNKSGAQGGGFAIGPLGGIVEECRVTSCVSDWTITGTAIHQTAGRVSRCLIDNNSFGFFQCGTVYLAGGLIENCVIANNRMHYDGGGLYITNGIARNCTIFGNESTRNGCGVFRSGTGRMENCIVWGNIHRTDPTKLSRNLYGATTETVVNCCTPEAVGSGTVTDEPRFVDDANGDFRQQASSPCIDAGLTALNTADTDFGGSARVIGASIDIGAFEFDTSRLGCGLRATPAAGMAPLAVTLTPTVHGTSTDTNLLELVWRINRGLEAPMVVSNTGLQSLTRTLDAGWHTVTLEVTDPLAPATAVTVVTNAVGLSPATLHVVTENTNACAPYATWETAATNLHDALALARDGALILVSNGTYRIPRQLIFDRGITMRSVGGRDVTTIQAPMTYSVRVALLCHADARIEGFTLRDGRGGNGNPGGGVLISVAGGTLFNCRVTANSGGSYDSVGGGVCLYGGRVSNCIIDNNRLTIDSIQGMGVYQTAGILENCLIVTNKTYTLTQNGGGGVYLNGANSVVRNCTIVGNTAAYGGGIQRNSGTVQNCIIVDNITGLDTGPGAPNWANAHPTAWQNICTPVEVGTNCVTADPQFVNAAAGNYQLLLGSPCIDAGLPLDGLPEDDLAGIPRVTGAGIDIGAYEYDARVLSCGILATPYRAVTAADVQLSASYFGFDAATNDLHFAWVLDDEAGTPVQSGMGLYSVQHNYSALGRYTVRLTITDPATARTVTTVATNAVHIAPATLYLVQSNSVPCAPYDTWATAATNIHEVLAEAVGGSTVLISNGTYDVSQTIALDEGIVLRGVHGGFGGWEQVVLKGRKVTGVRILDINHSDALVEGVTISGGKTAWIGFGGGVNVNDGTLRRCLITDNAQGGYARGAGANQVGGLISGCIISNNAPCESAGGLAMNGGICENTLITASRAAYGGGVILYGGILRNCTITGNTGTSTDYRGAGGLWRSGGTVVNCIIWGNTASNPEEPGYPDWSGAHATAYQNNCTSVAVGENGIVADPLFRDAARRDYRLTPHSPCRDKGLYQTWMAGAGDLWGNPRVDVKTHVDIGAHEEQSSLSTMLILR